MSATTPRNRVYDSYYDEYLIRPQTHPEPAMPTCLPFLATSSNDSNGFCNLPTEVKFLIVDDNLDPDDMICLAMTCHAFFGVCNVALENVGVEFDPMRYACTSGDAGLARRALEFGMPVNRLFEQTSLGPIAQNIEGHLSPELVGLIMEYKPNLRTLNRTSTEGHTPLQLVLLHAIGHRQQGPMTWTVGSPRKDVEAAAAEIAYRLDRMPYNASPFILALTLYPHAPEHVLLVLNLLLENMEKNLDPTKHNEIPVRRGTFGPLSDEALRPEPSPYRTRVSRWHIPRLPPTQGPASYRVPEFPQVYQQVLERVAVLRPSLDPALRLVRLMEVHRTDIKMGTVPQRGSLGLVGKTYLAIITCIGQ
ncbi:hypothetical protein B0H66DRAFT_600158 [Apodospora peruviana]|uniref:F-box domain-containing protein n=1 Tax=Apodospora peruviana TaxID=516989 RepID=A0AAE0IJE2_9PEZI|nr:hypothetical protein B0H66DRAFT_600158 [Apodospora peruviana]